MTSPLAHRLHATNSASGPEAQSPQHSASATSGTYFRAVRPTTLEADAVAGGEPAVDCAKVEGLRFELDVGIWRSDTTLIARRVVADAECVADLADLADDGE
jgi:hypothetical protein